MSLRTGIIIVSVSVVAVACGDASGPDDGGAIDVVASFYPLAEAAAVAGGDQIRVANLTPPGVEPHDLELGTDDLIAIADADVVLMLGGGFQPAVEEAVQAEATGIVVNALDGIPLLASDPHVWLDPALFSQLTVRVGDALTEAGADAATVDAAVRAFTGELDALDREFADGLASCTQRTLLVNHEAFGYLAAAYGLTQEAISGVSPEAEPDPARLAELAELARAQGVTTVFTEALVSPEVAETLADEAGLATAVLNPLEGLTPEQVAAGDDYAAVMRDNLAALRDGLGCS